MFTKQKLSRKLQVERREWVFPPSALAWWRRDLHGQRLEEKQNRRFEEILGWAFRLSTHRTRSWRGAVVGSGAAMDWDARNAHRDRTQPGFSSNRGHPRGQLCPRPQNRFLVLTHF